MSDFWSGFKNNENTKQNNVPKTKDVSKLFNFKDDKKLNENDIFVDAPKTYNPNSYQDALSKSIGINASSIPIKTPTVLSNKGVPVKYGPQLDKNSSIAGSATAGLLDSVSLGLVSKGMDKLQPGITQQAQQDNPTAFQLGKFAGYVAPASVGAKLLKPALKGIVNPIVNRLAEGALIGGTMTGIEDKVNGKSWGDTGKDALTNMALGGALDLGLYGLGKAIPKVSNVINPKWQTTFEENAPLPKQEVAVTKPQLQLNGKFKVKNTALDNAQQEFNNAIETIHNHFKTNQLTPEEIARIKPELGIDLDKLINNVETAKTDVRSIAERQRLGAVAGVNEIPTNKLQGPLKLQGNVNTPLVETTPTANGLNPSLGANDRTHSIQRIVSSDALNPNTTPKDVWNNFYTRFVDVNNPMKQADENTFIKATNSKNSGGIVDHIAEVNLVNRQGNPIGESLKSVVKDIPKGQENDFMNYVLQKHNIDRAREGRNVYQDFTSEQSTKAAKLIEQQHLEYKALNDRLIKFVNTFEKEWANNSGLVSDNLWTELNNMYKNYVPTQRSFEHIEQGAQATGGRGMVDTGNSINRATGSERDILNPLENIMNMINRTVRTAKYNEVGQTLVEAINRNPAKFNGLAEIIPNGEAINPNVRNVVSVLVNGEPVNIRITNEALLNSLESVHRVNMNDLDNVVKKVNNGFKSLITTKNPIFAIRNIARDIPTYLINSTENNPIKLIGNLGGAVKDIITKSDTFNQYKALGGGGSNFFNSSNPSKSIQKLTGRIPIVEKDTGVITGYRDINPVKKALNWMGDKVETFNNLTETAPRLAEFKNSLQRGDSIDKAMYNANDVTTNFSRGGDIIKQVDRYVPFANAGVQGIDKLARSFNPKNPKRLVATLIKGTAAVTAPVMVADHMNKDNPNYQQLDNRTKDNYILLPNVFGEKDDNGNAKTFIKIPKSREYGVMFGSLIERALRDGKDKFKDFGSTVATNFAPANPLTDNLAAPAINIAVGGNKDFAGRSIVPQSMISDGRSKYLQYDETSTELSKSIAALAQKFSQSAFNKDTNLSPKQMDYLLKSYTGVVAQLGQPLLTKQTMSKGTTLEKALKPITTQFISDPVYSNQNISDFYDNYDKIKSKASNRNLLENIPSKNVTKEEKQKSAFTKASSDISALNKKIISAEKNNDTEEIKRLRAQIISIASKANNSIK